MTYALAAALAALLVAVVLLYRRLLAVERDLRGLDEEHDKVEAQYAHLLHESIARQPHHEAEHGGQWTTALRVETIARRTEKKIRAAALPALSRPELRRRIKEAATCPPRG